jgi:hypothetical protein
VCEASGGCCIWKKRRKRRRNKISEDAGSSKATFEVRKIKRKDKGTEALRPVQAVNFATREGSGKKLDA